MIQRTFLSAAFAFASIFFAPLAYALDPAVVAKLTSGESDDQVAAVAALVASGEERAIVLLQALSDGAVQVAGKQVLIVKGEDGVDAITGAKVSALPPGLEDVNVNNRLRRELESGIAALQLISPDRATRLAATTSLRTSHQTGFAVKAWEDSAGVMISPATIPTAASSAHTHGLAEIGDPGRIFPSTTSHASLKPALPSTG